jgi:hypothetical protein
MLISTTLSTYIAAFIALKMSSLLLLDASMIHANPMPFKLESLLSTRTTPNIQYYLRCILGLQSTWKQNGSYLVSKSLSGRMFNNCCLWHFVPLSQVRLKVDLFHPIPGLGVNTDFAFFVAYRTARRVPKYS